MSAQLFLDCFQALRNGFDRPFWDPLHVQSFTAAVLLVFETEHSEQIGSILHPV
jgi:hypothetical protein